MAEREQWITYLEQELKQVCEAAAAEKKRLEDELAEEKRKAMEATAQFNLCLLVRRIVVLMILSREVFL
jgi:glycerol dehydrogenase-like iron-containing ADH family enzyme